MYSSVNNTIEMKYIFICGCSMSGIGKGTTISSIGMLLHEQNYIVTAIKIDPYLNIDAGTMSPEEHGEVFVLDDGGEVDLDLGNYERALEAKFNKEHNITSGKIFKEVLEKERKGDYLGKTIQMVPHVTNLIKEKIDKTANTYRDKNGMKANICLVEIGGTVGDIESNIYFETIRQFIFEKGNNNCLVILLSYLPMIGNNYEPKTKLTQHGIKELKSLGLSPNIIVCRSEREMDEMTKQKIAYSANISSSHIISCYDVENNIDVAISLHNQNIAYLILDIFKLGYPGRSIEKLKILSNSYKYCLNKNREEFEKENNMVNIILAGKYCKSNDTYFSVVKSIQDACIVAGLKLNLKLINASDIETDNKNKDNLELDLNMLETLKSADGIIIPGGFGIRGCEGMIEIIKYARINKIPLLGICLGMQLMVVEYARNVLGYKDADTLENNKNTKNDVITIMDDVDYDVLGGTLRLGLIKAKVIKNSLSYKIYGEEIIYERHRHRYEVNQKYLKELEEKGLYFTGHNIKGDRMDMVEMNQSEHPFYYGLQSHPEFKSQFFYPSLPYFAFIMYAGKKEKEFENYIKGKNDYLGSKNEYDEKYFYNKIKKFSQKYEELTKKEKNN